MVGVEEVTTGLTQMRFDRKGRRGHCRRLVQGHSYHTGLFQIHDPVLIVLNRLSPPRGVVVLSLLFVVVRLVVVVGHCRHRRQDTIQFMIQIVQFVTNVTFESGRIGPKQVHS